MNAGDKHLSSLVWHIVPLTARFHTSVGYCLFAFGLSRASVQINELLHTFFIYGITLWSRGSQNEMIMKTIESSVLEKYRSPMLEVLTLKLEAPIAQSQTEPIVDDPEEPM